MVSGSFEFDSAEGKVALDAKGAASLVVAAEVKDLKLGKSATVERVGDNNTRARVHVSDVTVKADGSFELKDIALASRVTANNVIGYIGEKKSLRNGLVFLAPRKEIA